MTFRFTSGIAPGSSDFSPLTPVVCPAPARAGFLTGLHHGFFSAQKLPFTSRRRACARLEPKILTERKFMKSNIILVLCVAAVAFAAGNVVSRYAPTPQTVAASTAQSKILYYQSPMHPWIKSDKPGKCPICGMDLIPVYADQAQNAAASTAPMSCCGGAPLPGNSKL
jgi:hypothetical protein